MLVIQENLLPLALMNILIENADSLEFLTSNGTWTKNVAEGKQFGTTLTAFDAAKKEIVGKFNIVAYIPASKQFINMSHGKGKAAVETTAAVAAV